MRRIRLRDRGAHPLKTLASWLFVGVAVVVTAGMWIAVIIMVMFLSLYLTS